MKLTDLTVANLQLPERGQKKYFCDSVDGFGIRVSQGGARTFFLQHGFDRRLISIGRYPRIKLSQARDEAKRLLAEFTLGRIRPQSITMEQAVQQFLEDKTRSKRAGTVREYKRLLSKHFPYKGQLNGLSVSWLLHRLDRLKDTPSEYNHALTAGKVFFNWCHKRRFITDNPLFALSPHKRPPRSRVLSDTELQLIWRACEQTDGASEQREVSGVDPSALHSVNANPSIRLPAHFATIVRLLILTGQRKGEITALRTDYFENDLCKLPSSLTKNGREHTIPIGQLTAGIIAQLSTGSAECHVVGLLFPARGKQNVPSNNFGKPKALLDKLSGVTGWTLHDIRRTFRTNLSKLGVMPHVSERLLNHVSSRGELEDTYDLYRFLPEMRAAIELWEAHLTKIFAHDERRGTKHPSPLTAVELHSAAA